jgi:hypothetical protein
MRNYVEPDGIYPTYERFGDYLIFKDFSEEIIDDDILDYYDVVNDYSRRTIYRFFRLGEKSTNGKVVLDDPTAFCIMDTGIFERMTNQRFVNEAFGDVLTFGLGLGFVLLPLLSDPSVKSITVVDNNQDIINKVSGYLKGLDGFKKINIVKGDAYNYYKELGSKKFDYIYFDHFFKFDQTIVRNMNRLKPKYEANVRSTTKESARKNKESLDQVISEYSKNLRTQESKIAYWGEDFLNNL